MLKTDFKGTGSLKEFVAESDKLFNALNNAEVRVPDEYAGEVPRLYIEESGGDKTALVLDMEDALLFTLNNVKWSISGGAVIEYRAVYVDNGKLNIVVKTSCP